jgi:hypothetical protein
MRVFVAAAVIASIVGSIVGSGCAYAQQAPVPRYGDIAKPKSPQEIEAEKEAQKAYEKSLGNIPDKGPTDPWGNVRSDSSPKPVAKAAPVKPAKTVNSVK